MDLSAALPRNQVRLQVGLVEDHDLTGDRDRALLLTVRRGSPATRSKLPWCSYMTPHALMRLSPERFPAAYTRRLNCMHWVKTVHKLIEQCWTKALVEGELTLLFESREEADRAGPVLVRWLVAEYPDLFTDGGEE